MVAAAAAAGVIVSGTAVVAVGGGSEEPVPAAASRAGADFEQRVAYYADVEAALSPLLIHVRALPAALEYYRAPHQGTPEIAARAHDLVEDLSTARDLVARLHAPDPLVGTIHELAVISYVESARALERLSTSGDPQAVARQGLRLLAMGDRLFDQAKRLLGDLRPQAVQRQEPDAYRGLPAPVPDWAASGLTPAPPPPDLDRVAGLRGEAAVAAVLSLLVETEARLVDGAPDARRRMQALAAELWSAAREFAERSGQALDPATRYPYDRTVLRTGGAFDGRPPPLRPGDDPGTGLPGGLPRVDARTILGGTP